MKRPGIQLLHIAIFTLLAVFLTACSMDGGGQGSDTPTPTQTDSTGGGTATPSVAVITGTASVDTVEIALLESVPVQVNATVKGNLTDACMSIDKVNQSRDGNTLMVEITTTRPADQMCAMVIVPYEETVPLDVTGLEAGTYTVNVNGVTETFVLP